MAEFVLLVRLVRFLRNLFIHSRLRHDDRCPTSVRIYGNCFTIGDYVMSIAVHPLSDLSCI